MMMFLQFFAWGAFFATMGAAFADKGLADFIAGAYGGAPIAAIIAPLFLGLIADRLFNSEKVMAVLLITAGFMLFLIPGTANDASEKLAQRTKQWMPWGITSQQVSNSEKNTIDAFLEENGTDADFAPLIEKIIGSQKSAAEKAKKEDKKPKPIFEEYQVRSAIEAAVNAKLSAIDVKAAGLLQKVLAENGKDFGAKGKVVNIALDESGFDKLAEWINKRAKKDNVKLDTPFAFASAESAKKIHLNHLNKLAVDASKAGNKENIVFAINQSLKQSGKTAAEKEINEVADLSVQGNSQGTMINWYILFFLLGYMPTLGLGNTIAFTHIADQNDFPKIRVWGTIGWIVAGLMIGLVGWTSSFNMFYVGGVGSVLLGIFCFFLPNTPPPLKGKPLDINSLLMVHAFKLLSDWNFLIFAVCSTLICIPLAYYYGQTSTFLAHTGFTQASSTMTIGQMSEIFFMLLIPFFFRKLGVKMMILVGMACWVIRYLLFAYGAPGQVTWMLLLAVALHGICYDFFFVTGFMYTDKKAPTEIRGQAQALLVFLTQGVGMYFGYMIMGWTFGRDVPAANEYSGALKVAAGEPETLPFLQQLVGMFNKQLPEGLNQDVLDTAMGQWGTFWVFPAIFAGVIMVAFGLLFWDTSKAEKEDK